MATNTSTHPHQTYAFRREDGTIERRIGAGYGKIWVLCTRCDGGGEEERNGPKACGACGGRGEVDVGEDPENAALCIERPERHRTTLIIPGVPVDCGCGDGHVCYFHSA